MASHYGAGKQANMSVQITIQGDKELRAELQKLSEKSEAAVMDFVEDLTLETHARAVRGIQRGPATGRVYGNHQASAPGEYPMTDTGGLAASVQFDLPTSEAKPIGKVGTRLLYGKFLELKPSSRGGRPWLSRAFREASANAKDMLRKIMRARGIK